MKKSALLAIVVLCLAVSTGVLGFMYSTKGDKTAEEAAPMVQIGVMTNKWAASAHGDSSSIAFRHWDEEGEVPVTCAKCHSSTGMQDYLGADGTAAMTVDKPAKVGSVVDCSACHNEVIQNTTSVVFPSGKEVAAEPSYASCWTCHQGMEAGINGSLDQKIGSTAPDDKGENLGFVNPHYLNVAGIYLGSEANAGYQYEGKTYAARFEHASGVQTCTECHDPHSLHLADPGLEKCSTCHAEVETWPDQQKIRRTKEDLDGDGNTDESTYEEINGLLERELQAMVTYSVDVAKAQIGNSDVYPYWFADKNGNGTQEEDEKQYADWTPRLMYAAYNFKLVKTSAGYIHNPTYSAQLLIDSISDLAAGDSAITVDGIERP